MERQSQNRQILEYLLEGHRITPIDALNLFGCFRLGARIHELRNMGYPIKTEVGSIRTNGAYKHFAVYFINPDYLTAPNHEGNQV